MESTTRSNQSDGMDKAPMFFFSFLGISCFASCAFFSLILGVGWLISGLDYSFNQWWWAAIPVGLILWGLVPFAGALWYYKLRDRH